MAKKISLYGILTALCICFGFLESLFSLNIAPGIKLGLANSVALILVFCGDTKGAFAVNTSRILLSSLLFSSPFSLVFSLCAGTVSVTVTHFISKMKDVTPVGAGTAGAVAHNLTQIAVASVLFGGVIWYYLPFLLASGIICGGGLGVICVFILKKIKTKRFF